MIYPKFSSLNNSHHKNCKLLGIYFMFYWNATGKLEKPTFYLLLLKKYCQNIVYIQATAKTVLMLSRSVTLCDSMDPAKLLCPWDSPDKNTGVGCYSLFQGIFPTQGLNPGFLNCRQILHPLSHQGNLLDESISKQVFAE